MNKQYKQWKKILATPFFLIGFVLFILLSVYCLLNFTLTVASRLPDYGRGLLTTPTEKMAQRPGLFADASLSWFFVPQTYFWFVYLLAFLVLAIYLPIRVYRMRLAFRDINLGTKGTGRFTTVEEVQAQYKAVPDNDQPYLGQSGSPVLHHENKTYIDTLNTHSWIDASTQVGKTELYSYRLLDLVMRAEVKDSIVITDIKGDMLKNTRRDFEHFGYVVKVLNILLPYLGMAYNPLELIKKAYIKGDYAKAQMLCNTLSYSLFHNPNAKDPMWEEASIALVNALVLAVCGICKKNNTWDLVTMYTVTVMLNELGSNPDEDGMTKLDHYFGSLPVNDPAKLQYGTIQFSQGITRSGIFTGTMAKLKNYTWDTIARMTARNDLNFEDLAYGDQPVALFIVYPDWDDSNYSIISTFLSQMNAVLSEKATLSKETKLPRRVRSLYEEVANIPAIEGLSRAMNVGASRGLLYSLVVQSKAQLVDKYGKEQAEAIVGACGNQYYIMSDGLDDAEDFSKKLGYKTEIVPDRQGDPMAVDKSYSEREEERPLMMPDELRRLRDGEWIVIRTKHRHDNQGKRIVPYPIFASVDQGTQMLHRYENLKHRFNHPSTFEEMGLEGSHKDIDLNKLVIQFNFESVDEPYDTPRSQVEQSTKKSSSSADKPVKKEKEGENPLNKVEGISEEETRIFDAISRDQYTFLKNVVEKHAEPDQVAYFEKLGTLEEIRHFFSQEENQELYHVAGVEKVLG
jgi:Type IV secretory pathway, VirD4 components